MKIGIFVFETAHSVDTAILAKRAEELGFEAFWVPEHAVIPVKTTSPFRGSPDGVIPDSYKRIVDPFIALARAAAVTQTIKLGTGVCLVPERNPLILAKEVATLDHFSGGRFIFGIGAGWLKEETEIMGGDFSHRWTQTREAILAYEGTLDQGRGGVPREVLRLPSGALLPQAGPETPSPPSFWVGTQEMCLSG